MTELLKPYWKTTPSSGVTATMAYGAPAVADCLIMTPALAQGSVGVCEVTRATTLVSPLRGWDT